MFYNFYVFDDINYRLKMALKDGSGNFFTDSMSFKEILEKEGRVELRFEH